MAFDAYTDLKSRLFRAIDTARLDALKNAEGFHYREAARRQAGMEALLSVCAEHDDACKAARRDTFADQLVKADLEREGV